MIYFLFELNNTVDNKKFDIIHSLFDDIEWAYKENKILARMKEYQIKHLTDNNSLIKYIQPMKSECKKITIKRTSQKDISKLDTVYETE